MCLKDFKLQPKTPQISKNVWKQSSEAVLAKFNNLTSREKKSHIRETKNLSTDADSSTDYKVIHNSYFLHPYLRVIIFF